MGVTGGIKSWARGLIKGEIKELTQLMYDARSLALRRMEEEAARLGADGVVGVDIVVNHHGDLMEVTATGTAIKRDPNWTPQPSRLQVVMDAASETSGKTQLTCDIALTALVVPFAHGWCETATKPAC